MRERCLIAVYMMTNKPYGTLYTGVTSDLYTRVPQHRDGVFGGFTSKWGLTRLVWYETHETMAAAIAREKQVKRYRRDWKTNLIERDNPRWDDLYRSLINPPVVWRHDP